MKPPAIFFDRDNTLIISDGYLADPAQVVLVHGAADAIADARRMGYKIVTISNQSGVARGMFSENDVRAVDTRMDEMLLKQNPGAIIDRHEFCPFHPDATVDEYRQDSDLRKPKPGMILLAAHALDLDLSSSWLIGDAPRDIEAGRAAGCRTILVRDPTLAPSPAAEHKSDVTPDATVSSLQEAIERVRAAQTPTAAPAEGNSGNPASKPNKLENLAEQILFEVRRRHEHGAADFSVSKLLAGVVQALALAALIWCYFVRNDSNLIAALLVAIFLQVLTVALLIMGRDR